MALPLPRRGPHGARHDRPLPSAPMRRTLLAAVVAALLLPAAAGATNYDVAIPGNFFSPSQLTVLVGDTVTWTNHDTATHTATARGVFDSGLLAHDQSFSRTFDTEGSYRFVCAIHSYMQGEVDVYSIAFGPGGALRPGQSPTLAPGQSAILKGQAPAGTEEVTIEQRLADGSHAPVATVLADAEGAFSVAVSPT